MRRISWSLALVASLVALSAGFYCLQLAIFHRSEDTAFYLLQDIAFLPIQVLLVTFVIDRLLARREKQAVMDKMNMVIGAFQAEVGTELLRRLIARAFMLRRTSWKISNASFSRAETSSCASSKTPICSSTILSRIPCGPSST